MSSDSDETEEERTALPSPTDRAQMCMARIREVLEMHRCTISPRMVVEQVGSGPLARMVVDADWGVFPNEVR